MSRITIEIISGTDRPNANALRISNYLKQKYESLGVSAGVMNLQDFPMEKVSGGPYGENIAEVQRFIKPLLQADGLIFVCPEYNGGYPGILKLFIDYLPFPESLHKKPVAFVGEATGSFGGLRAVEQLQQVASYRNAHVFSEQVFITQVHQNFDEERGIKDTFQQGLLESQVKNFVQYIADLNGRKAR